MTTLTAPFATDRLARIAHARHALLDGGLPPAPLLEPWIARSWQRCLDAGQHPRQQVHFNPVTRAAARLAAERGAALVTAARPVIERLSRAIAGTGYFAILTDADGVVVEVGPHGAHDDRATRAMARVGIDLSERAVGTTAIGAALAERTPVWLHRGEHFFHDTSVFTCAGAPLFGPGGDCVGMLDLTGVNTIERPELRLLAARSAHAIENAMVRARPGALLLQFNWPGFLAEPGAADEADALLQCDADGAVLAANGAARTLLRLAPAAGAHPHCADLFATPTALLFDAARDPGRAIEVPLWSGSRVQLRALRAGTAAHATPTAPPDNAVRLRDLETALIHRAVDDARGNVAEAARALGISRATVYRKLGERRKA